MHETVNVGAALSAELTHRRVGGLSIENMIGVDLVRVEKTRRG